jgi:hypothetical protein
VAELESTSEEFDVNSLVLGTVCDETRELVGLRYELGHRIKTYPVKTWSSGLLVTMIAAIDMAFDSHGGGSPSGGGRRHLSLVEVVGR